MSPKNHFDFGNALKTNEKTLDDPEQDIYCGIIFDVVFTKNFPANNRLIN